MNSNETLQQIRELIRKHNDPNERWSDNSYAVLAVRAFEDFDNELTAGKRKLPDDWRKDG